MSLDPQTGASIAAEAVAAQFARLDADEDLLSPAEMGVELAEAYHAYAREGTLPGANLAIGGTLSILESAFVATNDAGMPAQLAQGICDYWATNIALGVPAHGGTSVVSVQVNAALVLAAMTAAVQALITDAAVPDAWQKFFEETEAVVSTIPCIVTEMMPGSPPFPQAFPETIS